MATTRKTVSKEATPARKVAAKKAPAKKTVKYGGLTTKEKLKEMTAGLRAQHPDMEFQEIASTLAQGLAQANGRNYKEKTPMTSVESNEQTPQSDNVEETD